MTFASQVLQHGEKGSMTEIEHLIKEANIETICGELEKLLKLSKGDKYLKCIFDACNGNDSETSVKKCKIIIKSIKVLQQNRDCIANDRYDEIVCRLNICLQTSNMKPEELIKVGKYSLGLIQNGHKNETSWQYLIPTVFYNINMLNTQVYDNAVVEEYIADTIQQLLDMNWTQVNIVLLAEMLLEVELNLETNHKLIRKFTECIKWLDPEDIPQIVHYLVKTSAGDSHLLIKVQQYFGAALYNKKSYVGSVCSESTTDFSSKTHQRMIQIESYVFSNIAKSFYSPCVQKYLVYLKSSERLHEVILHPFNFTLLLTIATEHEMSEWFNVIKAGMIRYYVEEERRGRGFFREMISQHYDLEVVLSHAIENASPQRDVVHKGMIKLAFVLLQSNCQIGQEHIIVKLCRIAKFILIRILEIHSDMLKKIIIELKNAMLTNRNTAFIMECFVCIDMTFKYSMLDNLPDLKDMLENYFYYSNHDAEVFLKLLMKLTRYKRSIKEYVMDTLHKSLRVYNLEAQLNIVTTYLMLLKNLKISSSALLDQDSPHSQASIATQLTLTRTFNSQTVVFSNEAICRELITDLPRLFRLDADAKKHLYKGLPDVVDKNPLLAGSIWMFLWEGFCKLRNTEGDLPPINFENISEINGDAWMPTESISQLVMGLALILPKLTEDENYSNDFEDIATKIAQCDVEHFILDQDVILTDGSSEAQAQIYILHDAINIFDAFIAYYFLSWTEVNNQENIIKKLFRAQKRLVDYLRQYQGGKKKEKSNSTQSTSLGNSSRLGAGNKKLKLPNSIMPLHCFYKITELLYSENVPWTDPEDGNALKVLVCFHHYVLESLIETLKATKQVKHFDLETKRYLDDQLKKIETNIYQNCVRKQEQLREFDSATAALTLEVFYNVQIVNQHLSEVGVTENVFAPRDADAINSEDLIDYIETYKNLFDTLDMTDDGDSNRLSLAVVNTIALLAKRIPLSKKQFACKFTNWMKNKCQDKALFPKAAANIFATCLIDTTMRFTSSTIVLRLIVGALGVSMGWISEDTAPDAGTEMAMANNTSSQTILLQAVLNDIKHHLDDVSWIMKQIKLEYDYFAFLKDDASKADHQDVKRKERNVCSKLIEIVTLLATISNLDMQALTSALIEKVFQCDANVLKLLTTLATYFLSTSTAANLAFQCANFDGLMRHTMKMLVPAFYRQVEALKDNLKNQRLRPAVVLAIENLKKAVMQLSIKTKAQVYDNLGIGEVRGFRVKGLEQYIGKQNEDASIISSDDDDDDDDTNSIIHATGSCTTINEENGDATVAKKRRKK